MAKGRRWMRGLTRALAFAVTVAAGIGAGLILAAGAEAEDKLKNWKRPPASRGVPIE